MPRSLKLALTLSLACLLPTAVLAAGPSPMLLLTNATLITVDPDQPDAFSGYLQVGDDGKIIAIGAGSPPAGITAPGPMRSESRPVG